MSLLGSADVVAALDKKKLLFFQPLHSPVPRSEDPEAEDVGHKWTLSALLRHLRSHDVDTGSLMQRIEDAVIKAVLATAPSIIAACKLFVPHFSNCFGKDIDDDYSI